VAQSDRVEVIQDAARAVVALHPIRLQILELLATPASPTNLSKTLGIPRQHLNYHVRELESAGLVEMVEEKRKGSVVERIYQSTSKQYVVSPKALGGLSAKPCDVEDHFSSDYLIAVGSKLIEDVNILREARPLQTAVVTGNRAIPTGVGNYSNRRRQTIHTMALETEIGFATDADRNAFAREITAAVSRIAATYNKEDGEKFRVAIFSHPNVTQAQSSAVVEVQAAPVEQEKKDLTTVRYQVLVFASRENVFDALTNPIRLKGWIGEHVQIDPRVGGEYTIWGKQSYGAPSQEEGQGTIVALDQPEKLSVQTTFRYGYGTITWTLTGQDYGTSVQMECVLPGNEVEHIHFLNADFVELSLYNLRSYIESGDASCQPEFTGNKESLTVSTKVAASASDVFTALTDPHQMDKWISSAAEVQLRKNGRYTYGWTEDVEGKPVDAGPTRIIDLEPNKLLSHGWTWPGEAGTSTVTWEMIPEGSQTVVKLTHSGFGEGDKVEGYVQGWAAFLSKLKALLEKKALVSRPE
jgi:uncharacterized protein YndB with AHSA1/START domain/DNA-binding transcriptional ArsR family regulator